jgi:23S rRNA (cytidine1920-2'-O)/16S rRNA (cytidine1409-2'-O)-methyltransferase
LHRSECWHFCAAIFSESRLLSTRSYRETGLKLRIDKLLIDRGLAASRERAQALILAGKVLVNDQKIDKAGAQVEMDAEVRMLGEDLKYVSRGGLKLERALEYWQIDVAGKLCLDVGASTGGFKRSARK